MKNIILYINILLSSICFSQVGINTNNPQETLHVAGANSNIRVEGLNSTNNSNNLGGTDNYNLMVDEDGNLSVGKQSGLLISNNKLNTPVNLITGSNSELNAAQLYQENFTLSQRAIVVITYHISIEFKQTNGTGEVKDGRAKIAHNYFYLGNGTVPNTTKAYGMSSIVYSNYLDDAAAGSLINAHTEIIPLNAGTYSIHMQGAVFGGGLSSDAAFSANFGNGDRIDVSVIYL